MIDPTRGSSLALRREEQVVCIVAGSSASTGDYPERLVEKLEALVARDFEWDSFLRLAAYQHCLPATYRLFKDLGILELMSYEGRRLAEQEYVLSQARFIKKEVELLDVVQTLTGQGIDAVVLKGVPLAYLLYHDPGVRTLKDIDILVRPPDVEAAKRIMQEKGYELYTALRSAEDYERYHFHYVFSRGTKLDSIVEIHWNLVYPHADHRVADDEVIFNKAMSVAVPNVSIKTLSFPHAFWHMAMHVSYKSFMGFRNLAELKRIAMKLDGSDWDYVAAWSRRCNTDLELRSAVELSGSLFGGLVEPGFFDRLKSRFPARTLIPMMFYPRALVWEWVPFRDTHVLAIELMLRKSIAGKLRCLYHFIFPDRHMALNYHFLRGERTRFSAMRSWLNGVYVMLKVLALVCFFPLVVRSRLFGTTLPDPERHVNG